MTVIMSVFLLIAFTSAGKTFGKGEFYQRMAIARDLAITIETLYAVPGDVQMVYPLDLGGLGIKISKNAVTVFEGSKFDTTATVYEFADRQPPLDILISKASTLLIEKKGSKVTITGCLSQPQNAGGNGGDFGGGGAGCTW